jgi:hypothetical protein
VGGGPFCLTATSGKLAVIPYFAFGFEEKGFYHGVVAVYLGFGKAKNICLNGFHMDKGVSNVGAVVGKLKAIDILEEYSDDLCLPGMGGIWICGWM